MTEATRDGGTRLESGEGRARGARNAHLPFPLRIVRPARVYSQLSAKVAYGGHIIVSLEKACNIIYTLSCVSSFALCFFGFCHSYIQSRFIVQWIESRGVPATPRVSFLPDGAVCEAAAMVEKLSCVEKRKAFKNTRTSESRVTQLEHTRTV